MTMRVGRSMLQAVWVVPAVSAMVLAGSSAVADSRVAPGLYTSDTLSAGSVLLSREARVEGQELVLIGRYWIHTTETGGYVDLFPGHRAYLNGDGVGGYSGPAFLGPFHVGEFVLTPLPETDGR